MAGVFYAETFLPMMLLGLLGWAVPKLLSLVMPEGVIPLLILGVLSAFVMALLSSLVFLIAYMWEGIPFAELTAGGFKENVAFYGRLALMSGLIWGPVMVLSVAGLPRTWKTVVW